MIYFEYNFIVVVVVSDSQFTLKRTVDSNKLNKLPMAMVDSFLLLICLNQSIVLSAVCLCEDDDIVTNTIEQTRWESKWMATFAPRARQMTENNWTQTSHIDLWHTSMRHYKNHYTWRMNYV